MLRVCKENRQSVLEQVRAGKLDAAMLSTSSLIDDIIIAMYTNGILSTISKSIPDRRAHNTTIPYNIVWASAIAAKMKLKTSLTDIPFAFSDHRTLAKLGYTIIDIEQGLMQEGSLRFLFGKYSMKDLIDGYNKAVQICLPDSPNIHILDCTDIEVNFFNENYEGAGISFSKRNPYGQEERARGYKLSTLRGIVKDTGIIEEICLGPLNVHDLALSENMLRTTSLLKPGDILINDRGFIKRELVNYLKSQRGVDVYVPLRKNMLAYQISVDAAKKQNKWINHPQKRYRGQKVCLVTDLRDLWQETAYELNGVKENDVPLNGCVIWESYNNHYAVIVTTDTSKSAKDILKIYSLRPEIEEDYRQLKDFWKLEDFKSTKLNMIAFHIVSVLFGYLFFQLYTMLPEGVKYVGRSLPVVLKNYVTKVQGAVVLYVGGEFGILTLLELMDVYAKCSADIQNMLKPVLQQL